ncbi:aldehyde dehydrogenase family protein [Rhizobium sp. A37_96]
MLDFRKFFIDGKWVAPIVDQTAIVTNPATEEGFAEISLGSAADVDNAVAAARRAFPAWRETTIDERIAIIGKIADIYEDRLEEIGRAISQEMGAPIRMAVNSQAEAGLYHTRAFLKLLETFQFERPFEAAMEDQRIILEPIGVCGLITPWNWPMNQLALKVIPALAAGCTMVLKPSEIAPVSSMIFADIMEAADVPAGVFNLVNGEGHIVGDALSAHPDVDMMSLTGSTRAGTAVTKRSAETIKRVSLELGGKSPMIIFADADINGAVKRGVEGCFDNTGQSCNAPTRMLVERSVYKDAVLLAAKLANETRVDQPDRDGDHLGPLASSVQYERVQAMILAGIDEGARLVAGGSGRPAGLDRGCFVRPTVFADVDPAMRIAREEIFGPVLAIIPFDHEEEAVRIANDSPFGLAAYVETLDLAKARRIGRQLRAGMVQLNGTRKPPGSPFGGYKQSGNGREGGKWGLEEFLEVKLMSG